MLKEGGSSPNWLGYMNLSEATPQRHAAMVPGIKLSHVYTFSAVALGIICNVYCLQLDVYHQGHWGGRQHRNLLAKLGINLSHYVYAFSAEALGIICNIYCLQLDVYHQGHWSGRQHRNLLAKLGINLSHYVYTSSADALGIMCYVLLECLLFAA
jgi:hypothetical protein